MTPNLLKILWFLMPLCGLTAALLGWTETRPPVNWTLATLFVLSLLCWLYLTLRSFGFRKRLFNFFRLLLAGDYEAGIRTRRRFTDEISRIEELANKFSDQLRAYDRLRADRVSIHARTLDLILRHSNDRLIIADVEKETLTFNPATQKFLGISRKNYSFESILKPTVNETFAHLFNQAVYGRKVNTEGSCFIQLPGMSAPARLDLLLMPLRDREESVRSALLIIDDRPGGLHESV
jgi:PAS domain-containing protein